MPDRTSADPPTLCVGLGDWRCELAADTVEACARLASVFEGWAMPPGVGPVTTLVADLAANPLPTLRLVREGQPVDFSPFLAGPGGKRFVPAPHPTRRLYTDQAVGGNAPVLEACDNALSILRPDLWPFYVMHVLTWRMLCESPMVALHAAVCAVEGVALVIAGPSGCGKSTLCWALARQGADYFSDECAFFDLAAHRLYVRPHRARLRPGGVALLETPPEITVWQEAKPGDPKYQADLPPPRCPCPEKHVLLFADGFADTPRLLPIGGGAAARRVTRMMGFGTPSPFARLEAAADLVSGAPCRALTIGRPRETAEMLIAYALSVQGIRPPMGAGETHGVYAGASDDV